MKIENAEVTSFSWRVPAIDGLRALAMLMVYSYHVWQFSGSPEKILNLGTYSLNLFGIFGTFPAGVDLFMVLSGFCLFLPLCKSPESLANWNIKQYFVRRVRRIVPPYYAAILYAILLPQVLVILFRVLGQKANWQPFPAPLDFFSHLFFVHTLFLSTWEGINGSFWSLGLEAQFYLTFPLVVFAFRRFGTRVFWAMIGISMLYRALADFVLSPQSSGAAQFLYSIFFLGRWMQFALGMAAAWLVAKHWKAKQWRSPVAGSVAIALCAALYALAVSSFASVLPRLPLRDLLLGLSYAGLIIALCVTKTPLRALFENKAMVGLGFISYSFFLIHQPTAWFFSEMMKKKLGVGGETLFYALCSAGFLVVLGISYLFFVVFERPFLGGAKMPATGSSNQNSRPEATTASIQDQAIL